MKAEEIFFDLCLLEEMDDKEFITDILAIFLRNTPVDLMQLHIACIAENFENAEKTAHKLKSCAGLLKANNLLRVLIKIEDTAKARTRGILAQLAKQAYIEYGKMEFPLQQYLNHIHV